MIVWLASYPRSGNTFCRVLLNHLYGIKTYNHRSDKLLDQDGAADMVGHELLPAPIEELAARPEIYFVKTHLPPQDDSRAIYIVRDGRDALVSHARFRAWKHNKPPLTDKLAQLVGLRSRFERYLRKLIEKGRHGGWNNHVMNWTFKRPAGQTFHMKFEDLIQDPVWVGKALEGLKIDAKPIGGTIPSFQELNQKWPGFFRKGKTGSWREEMPEDLQRLFWEKNAEAMDAFGYRRD